MVEAPQLNYRTQLARAVVQQVLAEQLWTAMQLYNETPCCVVFGFAKGQIEHRYRTYYACIYIHASNNCEYSYTYIETYIPLAHACTVFYGIQLQNAVIEQCTLEEMGLSIALSAVIAAAVTAVVFFVILCCAYCICKCKNKGADDTSKNGYTNKASNAYDMPEKNVNWT